MEQYSDRQLEIFQNFYEDCKKRGIDPTRSEADQQRAFLLARENDDLVQILGEKLDGGHVEAYRLGQQRAAHKAAAEREAAAAAKIAKQRQIDERAAFWAKKVSGLQGRDKRLFFFHESMREANGEIYTAQQGMNHAVQVWAGLNAMEQQKEHSWGTLGGTAAGITGSTVVGAAVAADTMRKNAEIRAQNEAISKKNFDATSPMFDMSVQKESAAKDKLKKIKAEAEKVKLHLTEDRPLEELMDAIHIGVPQISYTEGNTVVVKVSVSPKKRFQIAGSVPAVIDGSFVAEFFADDGKIGEAYLNLTRDGLIAPITLEGYCLEAKPNTTYTVLILPLALWLIEKYKPSPITYSIGYGSKRQKLTYEILDIDNMVPAPKSKIPWATAPAPDITWQQRRPLRLKELEEKEKRFKHMQEVEANKKKKLPETIVGVLLLLAGAVMLIGGGLPNFTSEGLTARVLTIFTWTVSLAVSGLLLVLAKVDKKNHLIAPAIFLAIAAIGFIAFFSMTYL